MDDHIENCEYIHCKMAKGYIDMAEINLSISQEFFLLEDECDKKLKERFNNEYDN